MRSRAIALGGLPRMSGILAESERASRSSEQPRRGTTSAAVPPMNRFALLKPLAERRRDDAGDALRNLARQLADTSERGRIRLRLVGRTEDESQTWDVELAPRRGAKVAKGARAGKASRRAGKAPDLEIVTRAETWDGIAEGSLSPLEAFLCGKLRLRGDSELAKRIVRHLAADDGEVDICR